MNDKIIRVQNQGYELDFINKPEVGYVTGITPFAHKYGLDRKYVTKIINKDSILKDVSQKITTRDSKNRLQKMVFIQNLHFLYFLARIQNLKVQNMDPNFIKKLILIYPIFIQGLSGELKSTQNIIKQNQIDQQRYNKLIKLENYCRREKKLIVNKMKDRNINGMGDKLHFDGTVEKSIRFEADYDLDVTYIDVEIID